ncbi:MAG: four helix bundle protein [Prevotella sp.]|nr:four helix bundle protein [Prevotella sp.]MBQ8714054.1 four helix bundle protein [Prevotella sp.]
MKSVEFRVCYRLIIIIHLYLLSWHERNETDYWLTILYHSKLIDDIGYESMKIDNDEIIKLLVSSIKTMKKKSK